MPPPYDDDDAFDDYDLDDLPEDALDELESNAVQFTQAQHNNHNTTTSAAAEGSDYGDDDFGDDDLDDNVVIDESRSTPALNPTFQPRHSSQHNRLPSRSASIAPPTHLDRRSTPPPPPLFNQTQQPFVPQRRTSELSVHGSQGDKLAELQRQLDAVRRHMDMGKTHAKLFGRLQENGMR